MDRQDVRREARKMALLAVDDLLQRHLLSDALPRPRGHAAPHPRLRAAVRGVQRDRLDRRVRLRPRADPVPVDHPESDGARAGRKGGTAAVGRRRHPGVDAPAQPASVPQLPRAAGGEMTPEQRTNTRRTALALASIALAFFFGIMFKYVLLR